MDVQKPFLEKASGRRRHWKYGNKEKERERGHARKYVVKQIDIEVVLGVEKKEAKMVELQEKLYKEIIDQPNVEVDRLQTKVKRMHLEVNQTQLEVNRTRIEVNQIQVEVAQIQIEIDQTQLEVNRIQIELNRTQNKHKQ